MSKMKKVLLMAVAYVLVAALAVGGTLAYLQAEDSDVNVMTLGNVSIEQIEQERVDGTKGELIDNLKNFTQAKGAYPYTGKVDNNGHSNGGYDFPSVKWNADSDRTFNLFTTANNVVDKFVTVKNNGKTDAYVRTLFAFEEGTKEHLVLISANINAADWDWEFFTDYIEIDGSMYSVAEAVYKTDLKAGETTLPSLLQAYLGAFTTNEDMEALGETWNILALSQAVQTAGFTDAETALDTAFGKSFEKAAEWFGGMKKIVMASTYDEVVAALNEGQSVIIDGTIDKDIVIPDTYKGTLYLGNCTLKSIVNNSPVAEIVVNGNAVVENADGSAITGEIINISGSGKLTAIANGDRAYGIGGDTTKTINIKGITIDYVAGGHADFVADTVNDKHLKNPPAGGAAIGSASKGANVTLDGVTIVKAIGGSKAAGIGSNFWTTVNVTIKNSTIGYVQGGASAAAIGGSRVDTANDGNYTITIINSEITAVGGAYGAGIGSGYDSDCGVDGQPICTINIDGSTIKATGGKYAAGIGTGYHNAGLAGEIKNSTVTAASGDKYYKDTYTQAQDIGFGVVDPAREAKNNNSSITCDGTVIAIPAV